MTKTLFTDGWTFRHTGRTAGTPVRLPHDAMIGETRSADAATGNHGGFFPGGAYVYEKSWQVPADAAERDYRLVFEGVYGRTRVLLDGREVAACDSGYREFTAPLTGAMPGGTAVIEVHVDNTHTPNSRWYTGSGIYRPVHLESFGAVRIADDGIRIVTRTLRPDAIVDVVVQTVGAPAGAVISVELVDAGATAARAAVLLAGDSTAIALTVPDARPWSGEHPSLYDVIVALSVDGEQVDVRRVRTGLRTLDVSAAHGLRVNGEEVLLRGACVHHDNGPLGAATFAAAERRRACILKDAGFNAIRSSHNPLSRAFLDACDEIGLYVMDELTDVWIRHKTPFDGADRFESTWRADADAMIANDRNRPSVIMYSIGNEIAETSHESGVATARMLHAYVNSSDPTRPTTLAVNMLLNLMSAKGKSAFERDEYTGELDQAAQNKKKEATSTAANAVTAKLGRIMELAARLPAADKASRDAFAAVDVAGYNYAFGRYAGDRNKYPNRVMVGSESMPGFLPEIWRKVTTVPGVIGDFMWTGWDYLGEAGIGVWSYGNESGSINKPYPALVAGSGAFDITGQPGAPALLARAVWDADSAPGIAVRPLDVVGKRINKTPWRTSDAILSWSWGALRGTAEIEVYSPADQVELVLNGRSLGRRKAGERRGYIARFRTPYEPGELLAIAYRRGVETGRSSLRSAEAPSLRLRAEAPSIAGPDDLAYVWIELADTAGTVDSAGADRVTVSVEGAGSLIALGGAATSSTESFTDATRALHRGRALAIVRGSESTGTIRVRVESERNGTAVLELENSEPVASHPARSPRQSTHL